MPRAATRRSIYLLAVTAGLLARAQEVKVPDTPEILHIAPAPSDRFPAKWYPRVGDGTDVVPAPVLDKPYTAIVQTVSHYQSPSGEPMRQVTRGFQARDRFGRIRTETSNGGMTIRGQMAATKVVIVSDPVSHCQFHWTELTTDAVLPAEDRLAFVTCGPQTLRYKEMDLFESIVESIPEGTSTHGDTTTKTEHLAPLQIDGITVNRLRVTNSSRNEQGQDKQWTGETWYSPDLKEVIRTGDEENGYTALTEIHRRDPEPKLFYPPDGYHIEVQPAR